MTVVMKVRRTNRGPQPLIAGGRLWNPGDEDDMDAAEALVRINHGLFEPVVEIDEPETVAELSER